MGLGVLNNILFKSTVRVRAVSISLDFQTFTVLDVSEEVPSLVYETTGLTGCAWYSVFLIL